MSRNCKMLVAVVALITCVVMFPVECFAGEPLPVNSIAIVIADRLNLRREPQGEIISDIARGGLVTILSERDRNGYYRVRVESTGREYFAYGEYLRFFSAAANTPAPTATPAPQPTQTPIVIIPTTPSVQVEDTTDSGMSEGTELVVISTAKLNMRKKPSRKGHRIKYLNYGDRLQVVSGKVQNNYVLVRDAEGKVGYVSLDYVVEVQEFTYHGECTCTCPNCQLCYDK